MPLPAPMSPLPFINHNLLASTSTPPPPPPTYIIEVRVIEGVQDSRGGGPLRLVHILPQATQVLRGVVAEPVKDVLKVLVLHDG